MINDGTHRYYLLKVQRRGFDVYCFPPHLGVHHSLHRSGESHFRFEGKAEKTGKEPPVVLQGGEAGIPIEEGIICASLCGLGRASGICTAIYPIDSLSHDFQEFNRSAGECFVIDKDLLPQNTHAFQIGVWAVPTRNPVSFHYDHPNIPAHLLYKVEQYEPQIWIYAES